MTFGELNQPFVRSECLAAGISGRRVDLALGRGDLERIAPGVYALAAAWSPLAPWERHLALARAAVRVTPDAIVSHTSAAALLGMPMPPHPPGRATMTLLHDTRTSEDDGWRRLHRGHTPAAHVLIDEGRPFLVPARTVVDCMREMRPGDALAVLDAALRDKVVTGAEVVSMRRHQRRWPGIAAADAILPLADGRRESWFESTSAWAMSSWGLPPGIPQVVVSDPRGRTVGRVDVLWPELGVVGEADGRGKYLADRQGVGRPADEVAARAVVAQGVRESRLRDLGLEVVRWDPPDLRDPIALATRFHAAAARARPGCVTARYACSCCGRPLTYCGSPTRIAGLGGPRRG
jgi:hypothetical protein